DYFGAVGLQQKNFFAAHFVGHDKNAAITFDRGGDRQADPRIAGRGLDYRASGTKPSAPLGLVDHRQTDAVFDTAARVHGLDFDEDFGLHPFRKPMKLDEWGPAD